MANVTKTVKSSGGDYTSLNAALAGMAGNLTTNCGGTGSAGILTIECYAFEDTTRAATGTGYTTSADYYINITVPTAERHDGKWNTSKYRMVNSSGTDLECIRNNTSHIRIDGIQFCINAQGYNEGGYARAAVDLVYWTNIAADGDIRLSNSIIKIIGSPSNTGNEYFGIHIAQGNSGATPKFSIWNNIIYDFTVSNNTGYGLYTTRRGANVIVYNNTFVNNQTAAIQGGSATLYLKNNLFYNNGTDTSGVSAGNCDYNATSKASLGYTSSAHDRTSQTFTFVDAGNGDYHLAANDAGAKDHGVDLSSDGNLAFTTDIDGQTRSGTWDIGADEYVAAALPKFMYHYMHH